MQCRQTDTRPFLDGKLDDKCWQGVKPLVLRSADPRDRDGDPKKHRWADDYPTEVYLTYDKEYLYLGLVCRQPKEKYVAPVKPRPRDADVRPFDRVSLLLDVDRDYSTYYHLQIDQRGCTCEDCWGDLTWNPKWFVAVHSEPGVLADRGGHPVRGADRRAGVAGQDVGVQRGARGAGPGRAGVLAAGRRPAAARRGWDC